MPAPVIRNQDELIQFLRDEFAYCGCGYYEEAIFRLRDVLQFARERTEAVHDKDRFAEVQKRFEDWFLQSPGLATWFIWLLDERNFVMHGFRASDCWTTAKGEAVLDAIDTFYRPEADTERSVGFARPQPSIVIRQKLRRSFFAAVGSQ